MCTVCACTLGTLYVVFKHMYTACLIGSGCELTMETAESLSSECVVMSLFFLLRILSLSLGRGCRESFSSVSTEEWWDMPRETSFSISPPPLPRRPISPVGVASVSSFRSPKSSVGGKKKKITHDDII